MRVLCLGHYSGQRFEKDEVSVSEFIGLVWTEGRFRKKNTPFQKYPDSCAFTRLFLCVPGLCLHDVNFNY